MKRKFIRIFLLLLTVILTPGYSDVRIIKTEKTYTENAQFIEEYLKKNAGYSNIMRFTKVPRGLIVSVDERYLFLRGFFNELGLKTAYVKFNVKPRKAGKSKFNFITLTKLALDGITSYSVRPLRLIAMLGFLMGLFGFLVGVETVIEKIYFNNSPNGWATTVILLCIFGGLQIFCLGIIGEYVGQVFREVKGRPRYIKDDELL